MSGAPEPRPLADPATVYALCFAYLETLMDNGARLLEASLSRDQAQRRETAAALSLVAALAGLRPDRYRPDPGWSGGGLAASLRRRFAAELERRPAARRPAGDDDLGVILFAVMLMKDEIDELAGGCLSGGDAAAQARRAHLLCERWASVFRRPASEP